MSAEAGSSGSTSTVSDNVLIPKTGLAFYEYRRKLFLAGKPLDTPPQHLTDLTPIPRSSTSGVRVVNTSIERVKQAFQDADRAGVEVKWKGGVEKVWRRLDGGDRLSTPLNLSLVIKILKAGWVQDGTWPSVNGKAVDPPEDIIPSKANSSSRTIQDNVNLQPLNTKSQGSPEINPSPPKKPDFISSHGHARLVTPLEWKRDVTIGGGDADNKV